jgi:pyridinium-3,5-bisthiocarboxylic acid mononucleotide nickel chelatase
MTTLYIEPFGGMAGDMFLAALLDLGDERFRLADLEQLAEELVPGEARLSLERVWRGSLSGALLNVVTPETEAPPHRGYAELEALLRAAPSLTRAAADRACDVLWRIAEAEARVHDTTPDQIHFHEVGAVDSLIDVGGAALALERLGIERVLSSPPITGTGTVRCAHGEMPVPAPATAELLKGREVVVGGGGGERLTPTAAAILATWTEDFSAPGAFLPAAIGYGAGQRDPSEGPPNLVRVQLGEVPGKAGDAAGSARAWLLEVNLDDMTAEEIGHALVAVRKAGALEAWTAPIHMKKDRPGTLLSALAREADRPALEASLFEWTTTLGVRWRECQRTECGRRELEVQISGQAVRVKLRQRPDYPGSAPPGERDLAPEHDDIVRAAEALGLTLREARSRAIQAALAGMN